jgi:hypothetical protein
MTTWIVAALIASTVVFTDVSGSWTGTLAPEDKEPNSAHLVLRQEGDTITGTAGGDEDDQRFVIRNGTAKDGVVTFEVETPDGYLLKFVLKEQGDELSGTATRERNGPQGRATVLVKRVR